MPLVMVLIQEQHVFEYHVNTPFNKNTTASYALQGEKRWGHDFMKEHRGINPADAR